MSDMDISCAKCDHQEVCALKGDFEKAQNAVNNLTVTLGESPSGNGVSMKDLRHFDWIEPVKLRCKHFTDWKQPTAFRNIDP